VCDAHLLILQIHTSSFGAGQWGRNGTAFLNVLRHKKAFHRVGVQNVAEFDSD
jgi:hypothetical protein